MKAWTHPQSDSHRRRPLHRRGPALDSGDPAQRSERGAVLIEFATLMPLLMIMTMGIFQTGLILFQQQALHSAAREGAREAAFPDSTAAEIKQAANDAMVGASFGTTPTIVITPAVDQPCVGRSGEAVTVQLSATATLDIPFLAGQTVNLSSAATFRCE